MKLCWDGILEATKNKTITIRRKIQWLEVRVPVGSRILHSSVSSRPALRPTQCVPGREANHSPPTSAELKKTWIYEFTPSYMFVA
jgi:hypothetical protein